MKKIISILLITLLFSNCLVLKIKKDSPPLVDFGIPLAGHYRNRDTAKAIFYTVLFSTAVIGTFLFAPMFYDNSYNDPVPVINFNRNITDPVFYSFLGSACTILGASSIDTAVTYHYVNNKIIEINDQEWDRKMKITKYQFITDYQRKLEIINENEDNKIYKNEILYYKKKLIDATVTDEELLLIKTNPVLKKNLEKELGFYYIKKELDLEKKDGENK
ncbi:MAG: hypothetical protein JXB50_01995 [Spirochaetes bacterium]|nr:hypothetical protein [Spirochaetota bacterium]